MHLFGDYYAWSAVNDVKFVQTGHIQNFRYLMTGYGVIKLLSASFKATETLGGAPVILWVRHHSIMKSLRAHKEEN